MESEIEQAHINSDFFDKERFQKQLDIIKQAADLAAAKVDYKSAHDDNIILAIDIVENFLKKKHRLCYGGQAINAHLPAKYKFYDPEYSIPDYDFFTPTQDSDITTLVNDLKKAGFTEISAREGMHEGTIKIYVDFIPVADMTSIDPKLYKILSSREYRMDGISYLDANSLRMLMYLELSRPRGEVRRWEKVYERLALFNEFVPAQSCKMKRDPFNGGLNSPQVDYVLNFIIQNKRIFAGADLLEFYGDSLKAKKYNTSWIVGSRKPVLFFSSDAAGDAKQIREEFSFILSEHKAKKRSEGHDVSRYRPITIRSYSSGGVDLIPTMKVVSYGNKSLVFIIDQTACHSYFNVPMSEDKIIRVASLDTLITLFFSLGLLDTKFYDMGSMECLANKLVQLSVDARRRPDDFPFPFVSIKCAGHQVSLPSLIRAKVKRITQKKEQLKALMATTGNKGLKRKSLRFRIRGGKKSFRASR
jgi:hypothetical protein